MSAKEEAQVEARVLQLLERYLAVEEILGLPIEWDEPREAPYPVVQNVGEAERAAHILREHWGLGLDPISKPYEEPGALPPEKESPRRLERLCYRALAEGAISEAKTAELLGISAHELNRRLPTFVP